LAGGQCCTPSRGGLQRKRQIRDAKSAEAMMPCDPLGGDPRKRKLRGRLWGVRDPRIPRLSRPGWKERSAMRRQRIVVKKGKRAVFLRSGAPAWLCKHYKWPNPVRRTWVVEFFGLRICLAYTLDNSRIWELEFGGAHPSLAPGSLHLPCRSFDAPLFTHSDLARHSRVGTQDRTTACFARRPHLPRRARTPCGIYPL
jgi:hypothetical protein